MADLQNHARVELLGGFRVVVDGAPVPDGAWTQRRAADLVALLAMTPGHRLPRDQVVDALWPELAPGAGASNLHKAAHHARRSLDCDSAIVLRAGTVALFPAGEVVTDVELFATATRRALVSGDEALCAAAADLYPGDLLPDRRYDDWTVAAREELACRHLELLRGAGRWRDVVRAEPTDEAAHRALVREHVARGDRHAAVRQFQRLRAVLAREFGVRPTRETVALHREVVADLARARGGPASPLVGREVALARLDAALRATGSFGGPPVLVTGEEGIGKTRLCTAFLERAREAGFAVLSTSGSEPGSAPYAAVLNAARSAAPGLVEALPAEAAAALTGSTRSRQQLLAGVDALCRAAGPEQGTVLLVDDAHLADDDSVALLDTLARAASSPCALVLAFRPDQARPLLRDVYTALLAAGGIEIALPTLSRDESHELVTGLAGPAVPAAALERVWRLAEGNPFFTTELAAALSRDDVVTVPPTLAAAVVAGLAPLPAGLVDRLRRVAVAVDDSVDADEFAALTGLDEQATVAALDESLAAGVLVVDGDGYRFRHALVAHHLADGLAPHRRAAVHRDAAEVLVARDAPPARVARHLIAGGRTDAAVPWLVRAARAAAAVSAYADALRHVEAALAVEPSRADLLGMRAEFLLAGGDPAAPAAFGSAVVAATGPDRDRLRIRQAWALLVAGDVPGAALALDGVVASESTRLPLAITAGMLAWFSGRFEEAECAARQSVALAAAAGEQAQLLDAAFLQALVAHSGGRWAEQFRSDLLDPRLAGALAGILSDAHLCAAEIYLFSGDPAEIVTASARLRDAAADAGAARGEAFATTLLGEATLLAGDLGSAEELLLDGARRHRALRARSGEAVALHRLAELAIAAGRHCSVAALLDQALEAARLSPLASRHLFPRIFGTRVQAAAGDAAALAVLDEAARCMVRPAEVCPADRVPYLVPAAIALARSGRPDAAAQMLGTAEMLVGMLWHGGGCWAAAVTEARAELAFATGDPAAAHALLARASDGFSRAGQPLEAARCRARDLVG